MKESYDVVIIGAGGAGMAAAIEAKDAGLNPRLDTFFNVN
ncbi:hypothetical protein EfmAA96_06590 [Enterococcus faecium]|nr:hypothetical protein EfmAA96_06590 [Enterococcus faecium]